MNSYNYTQGLECKFNFYVITFDPQNSYENFRPPVRKAVTSVPIHISAVMGVNFITDNINLEPDGMGAVDLIHFNNGTLELSQDINSSQLLKNEPLISVNAGSELNEHIPGLQNEFPAETEFATESVRHPLPDFCTDGYRSASGLHRYCFLHRR